MKKVILSFPYSGAIQAFFAHQLVGMDTHREPDSYYGTLWGKPDSQLQAFSLTLFTLYDEVIFAPVDNALPDSDRYWGEQEYYHPDLGLRMPARADAIGLDYHALNDYIDWVLADPRVNALLSKVPALSRRQIMLQVICDLELSIRHGAQVMSNAGRRSLMRRLCEIDPQYNNAKGRIVNVLTPQAHVLDVLLPDFEINSVDLLHRIKGQGKAVQAEAGETRRDFGFDERAITIAADAPHSLNLVLVARRADRLQVLVTAGVLGGLLLLVILGSGVLWTEEIRKFLVRRRHQE